MKAVLCLWAREHLKGRPGPGSGLARLLEKKKERKKRRKTQHSPLCMCVLVCVCVCVFGKERQNRTAVPGYSWQRHSEEQTELSLPRRAEGLKKGFNATEGCSSPLTCCPAAGASGLGPHIQEVLHLRRGARRRDEDVRGGDETPCRDHCAGGLRGAGRGFQPTVFILGSSAWTSQSRAPDC